MSITTTAASKIPPLSILPSSIIFSRDLNLIDYRLLVLLSSHGNRKKDNHVWLSILRMAELLKESRKRIYESLEKLQRLELIKDTGQKLSKGVRVWKILTQQFKQNPIETPPPTPPVPTPPPPVSIPNPPVSTFDTQTEDFEQRNKKLTTKQEISPVDDIKKDEVSIVEEVVVVSFPDGFPKSLQKAVRALLKMAPKEQRQDLVNEFAYRIKNSTIKNYTAYFAKLVRMAVDSVFIPSINNIPDVDPQREIKDNIKKWKDSDKGRLLSANDLQMVENVISSFYKATGRADWNSWKTFL